MGTQMRSVVAGELSTSTKDIPWSTTETSLTLEEEDAIVTLVVVVIGVIVIIVILFSMGIFIDCKHQKKETPKKRKLRLKIPQISRVRRTQPDDVKSFASDMCPNDITDSAFPTRDAIV
ncbi:uncharacterized protein LOC122522574 [Polistes fuscatus]|uniref:uncharacterized protein LOC106786609 n=1 Tax=Polistes canadensis TaxID=91411 RepID=UPI000718FF5E|nr:PREDICTED: uncharacterized protein LOC106786609 [Polistes canadensis]XP_043499702.1 uncharacterized protein LOC122522574 [Polistes fuscatus]